jgi:hypothetical protein
MQETLSNGEVKASRESETTIADDGPLRDLRALAAFGGVAGLGAVVIGAGVILKAPSASAVHARIGLSYTHCLKLFGGVNNFDGAFHNASQNNTLFAYVWTAF